LLELNAATAFAKALNARGEAAYAKSILGPVVSAFRWPTTGDPCVKRRSCSLFIATMRPRSFGHDAAAGERTALAARCVDGPWTQN